MTDIVERIQARFPRPQHADDGLMANEAADMIVRLREANDSMRKKAKDMDHQISSMLNVIDAAVIIARKEIP